MAQGFKYKSFYRTLTPGHPYQDAAQALDVLGAQGWELVDIFVVRAGLENEWVEVFYLKQETVVTTRQADSPAPP